MVLEAVMVLGGLIVHYVILREMTKVEQLLKYLYP